MLPARLARLPPVTLGPPHLDVRRARGFRARLLGLAGLASLPSGTALLIERTRSVHTFGMRFALDLVWLDEHRRVVRIDRAVSSWRQRTCVAARAVVELAAGGYELWAFSGEWAQSDDSGAAAPEVSSGASGLGGAT